MPAPRSRADLHRRDAIRILLLERLDAIGAAPQDAALRLAALRGAGCSVRGVVIGGERVVADGPSPLGAQDLVSVEDGDAGRDEILAQISCFRPDLAIVASADAAPIASWLPAVVRGMWWPTALRVREAPRTGGRDLPALVASDPGAVMEASRFEPPRHGRSSLPLWDGDYVLAAGPLSGPAGGEALKAFAAVAADCDALDLVVLADPQPAYESMARALGIGARVHFAGRARRGAEYAWLRSAAAVLIAGDAPLSGAMVLRALASGAPLLPIGEAGVPGIVAGWLERHGIAAAPAGAGAVRRMKAALDRSAATGLALERGAAMAATHDVAERFPRLVEALAALNLERAAA